MTTTQDTDTQDTETLPGPGPADEPAAPAARAAQFHGATVPRGLRDVARSVSYEGRFGRMFRELPPCIDPGLPESPGDDLAQLARVMAESIDDFGESDNPNIPAGFTYLGQFVDHDITFDPTSKLQRENDPNALRNFRTPRFDLDSLYGPGPDAAPYLYRNDGVHLLLGTVTSDGTDDVPRNNPAEGEPRRALLGDPRNDENIIISQVHLAFLKFHNAVVDALAGGPSPDLFDEACRIVRWHYQWIVVHDLLVRIVGEEVVNDILQVEGDGYRVSVEDGVRDAALPKVNLKFYDYKCQPYMPVEFSVAAYRFGHSMVRPFYDLNEIVGGVQIFSDNDGDELSDLRGFRERPARWDIEWPRFFDFGDADLLQHSRKIDSKLALALLRLPPNLDPKGTSLAERNLRRGKALGLPSGQAVAGAMGIPADLVLTADQMGLSDALRDTFGDNTPLWYYILREAEIHCRGTRLGPVGGRIVAEVLIGLLAADPLSYLRVSPGWRPAANAFGAGPNGEFTMVELLRFAKAGRPLPDPTVLHVGGNARVTGDGVRMRTEPGTQSPIARVLAKDTELTVIEGPQLATDLVWWQCATEDGAAGWVAALFLQPF